MPFLQSNQMANLLNLSLSFGTTTNQLLIERSDQSISMWQEMLRRLSDNISCYTNNLEKILICKKCATKPEVGQVFCVLCHRVDKVHETNMSITTNLCTYYSTHIYKESIQNNMWSLVNLVHNMAQAALTYISHISFHI